jgi:hypothetical protein
MTPAGQSPATTRTPAATRVQDLFAASTVCNVEHRQGQSSTLVLRHCIVLMQRSAMRRVEDKIRRLSAQLLAVEEDEELTPVLVELREALHQHIQRLRARLASYPIVVERRVRNGVPPSAITTTQNPTDKSRPTTTGLTTSVNEALP